MSILSSAKNLVKKVAKKTYETVNKIGSYVSNLGSSNQASAGMLFPVGENLTKTQTQKAYDVISKGGSGSNIPSGAQIAPKYSSTPYGPTLPVTINAGQQKIPTAGQESKKMNDFSAQLGASSGTQRSINTSSITSAPGSSSPGTLMSSPSSYNPGNIDNTKLAGTLSDTMTYDAKNNQFVANPVDPTQQSDEQIANRKKKLFESVLGTKPDVYEDPQVRRAMKERNDIQKQLNAQTSELNAIIAKQTQDTLQLGKTASDEGTVEAVYGRQVDAINYNAAIRALPIQASIATLQGQLDLAQDNLTELTRIKTEQVNTQYEYNKNLLNSIEGSIDQKDKEIYDQLKTQNERAYNDHRDLIKFQEDISLEIIKIKNSSNISSEILSNKLKRINQAQTRADVMVEASDILGSQFGAGAIGEYSDVIGTVKALVPAQSKQIYADNISNAIKSNDYVTAYAEIANAVEEKLTGEPKTKFANARNDVGVLTGMRDAIKAYSDSGGDTGLLKGTEEQIKRKLGIDSGKASTLAVQLWREFQTYRSNMTGAAFSPSESRDYASVNPTLGKSLDLNFSVIDGAVNQLNNRIVSTITQRIPNSKKIYDIISKQDSSGSNQSVDYTATLDSIFK